MISDEEQPLPLKTRVFLDKAKMVEAMKDAFRLRIEDGTAVFNDGTITPFAKTGVSMPRDEIWENYAQAIIDCLED